MMVTHLRNTGLIRLTPTPFRRTLFILSGKIKKASFGLALLKVSASLIELQKNLQDINPHLTLPSTTQIFGPSMKTTMVGCGWEAEADCVALTGKPENFWTRISWVLE